MKIIAKQNARKWVKERLKRHPGNWTIDEPERSVPCWQGELAIHAVNDDGWSAWIPVVDIEIKNN